MRLNLTYDFLFVQAFFNCCEVMVDVQVTGRVAPARHWRAVPYRHALELQWPP